MQTWDDFKGTFYDLISYWG